MSNFQRGQQGQQQSAPKGSAESGFGAKVLIMWWVSAGKARVGWLTLPTNMGLCKKKRQAKRKVVFFFTVCAPNHGIAGRVPATKRPRDLIRSCLRGELAKCLAAVCPPRRRELKCPFVLKKEVISLYCCFFLGWSSTIGYSPRIHAAKALLVRWGCFSRPGCILKFRLLARMSALLAVALPPAGLCKFYTWTFLPTGLLFPGVCPLRGVGDQGTRGTVDGQTPAPPEKPKNDFFSLQYTLPNVMVSFKRFPCSAGQHFAFPCT